ncbi:hypothetical protein ACFW3Y_34745 [Streptomyces rochei]
MSAEVVDDQLLDQLVSRAQAEDLKLTGEGRLLQRLTGVDEMGCRWSRRA